MYERGIERLAGGDIPDARGTVVARGNDIRRAVMMARVTNYLLPLLAIDLLLVVHAAGHYVVARWCGMRVEELAIGFGPALLKRTSRKTGTVFQLALIPFGGFVKVRGMSHAEQVDSDDETAYPNRPWWQRLSMIISGSASNYLFAIALAMVLFTCHGIHRTGRHIHVAAVLPDYDAVGKLEPGDQILTVDGDALFA